MLDALLGGLLIFCLRLGDVPIGTLRTILMVQGRKIPVALLAVLEAAIYLLAIGTVLAGGLHSPYQVVGYALGFASGTVLGMYIEGWLAFGMVLVRVISSQSQALRARLREEQFGVTAVRGEGMDGEVYILFVVLKRRRKRALLKVVREIDPHAFITVEPVGEAHGGYVEPPLTPGTP
jgi:uncharacterized protein YebE (UPF0316 family)